MKITIDQAVIEQALDFIEANTYGGDDTHKLMTTLRTSIEQAQKPEHAQKLEELGWSSEAINKANTPQQKQEPVAWTSKRDLFQMIHAKAANIVVCEKDRVHTEPLYTSPPQRQPEQAQKQEPVAWIWMLDGQVWDLCSTKDRFTPMREGHVQVPLYTSPPQRQPQYDKTEMNKFVQDLYDKKMREGKHGHYETMFYVVHQAIETARGIKGEA